MKITYASLSCKLLRTLGLTAAIWIFLCGGVGVADSPEPPVILALGDSLTAGFGVQEQESYPSRLQKILRQEGYPHKVVNAGVSGDTSAGGLRRIRWLMQHDPQIVIVALGANDGLRGLPLDEMRRNLAEIVEVCLDHGAEVLLAGMKIPPNYGEHYARGFEQVYRGLAEEYDVTFMPFLLEDVAARRQYTQADGIHPVGAGYRVVARNVWDYLKPLIQKTPS